MFKCKYCKKDFEGLSTANKANHSRWCKENPKRSSYQMSNNCAQMCTPEAKAKRIAGIKKAHADGKYDNVNYSSPNLGKTHSPETKALLSQKALASKHRRLVRSIREYAKKDGTIVTLDSSWEEILAMRLDEIGINWIRPKVPISYVMIDGRTHNYFPDFYLPDHDIYLDPKNPHAADVQKTKLDVVKKLMPNLKIISSLDECKTYMP